jgi:hypothetical protein
MGGKLGVADRQADHLSGGEGVVVSVSTKRLAFDLPPFQMSYCGSA